MSTPDRTQDDHFLGGEGDRYFTRNRAALRGEERAADPALRLLRDYGVRPRAVVEPGCANGWRLEELRKDHGCRAVGFDASAEAIDAGRRDYPGLELHQGTLAEPPEVGTGFDLAIVYFVLHWNARETLLQACANVDRLLAPGGLLVVGDFLPAHPQRRVYHHAPGLGLYTYKQDYPALFTATGIYREVARMTFDHDTREPRADVPPSDRGVCALLRKVGAEGYPEAPAT
jgi:SAM-dependent methyltransferase